MSVCHCSCKHSRWISVRPDAACSVRRGVELARVVGLGERLACLVAAAEDIPDRTAARPQAGGEPGGAVRLLHEVGPKQPLLWVADAMCGAVTRDRSGESAYLDRLVARVTVRVIEGRRSPR